MIDSDTVKPEDDDELSDEEEDMDATDREETEEEAAAHEDECGDHSFLTTVMESFMEKVSFLKSRDGRAGLVHNFLRGLQLLTAPVPKGETLMLLANIFSFLYFAFYGTVQELKFTSLLGLFGIFHNYFLTS